MLATSLVFGCLLSGLFFLVGLLIGWVAREYMVIHQDKPFLHSEFFDKNGNVIPDEIVAFRFENSDYEYDDTEEDD